MFDRYDIRSEDDLREALTPARFTLKSAIFADTKLEVDLLERWPSKV
jgi:hypothetical protein